MVSGFKVAALASEDNAIRSSNNRITALTRKEAWNGSQVQCETVAGACRKRAAENRFDQYTLGCQVSDEQPPVFHSVIKW
jgi:hypothetical protein